MTTVTKKCSQFHYSALLGGVTFVSKNIVERLSERHKGKSIDAWQVRRMLRYTVFSSLVGVTFVSKNIVERLSERHKGKSIDAWQVRRMLRYTVFSSLVGADEATQ